MCITAWDPQSLVFKQIHKIYKEKLPKSSFLSLVYTFLFVYAMLFSWRILLYIPAILILLVVTEYLLPEGYLMLLYVLPFFFSRKPCLAMLVRWFGLESFTLCFQDTWWWTHYMRYLTDLIITMSHRLLDDDFWHHSFWKTSQIKVFFPTLESRFLCPKITMLLSCDRLWI